MLDRIGRIELVPIREVFPKEAQHLTVWLEQHIEALSERLGIELSVVEREKRVGDFIVDLLCQGAEGHAVIVENQLEKSNHDHLGKLLTYLVNLDAKTAIWITPEPRIEHKRVIDWLNEATPADVSFYLVRVEAVKIGASSCAPLFTVLAAPDDQTKAIGVKKKEWADGQHKRLEFWTQLITLSGDGRHSNLFANRTAGPANWIGAGVNMTGVQVSLAVGYENARGELYIDTGKGSGEKNKAIFDSFHLHKTEIETEFGAPLEWLRLDDKRASIIRRSIACGGLADETNWAKTQELMLDVADRFARVFKHRLTRLKVQP